MPSQEIDLTKIKPQSLYPLKVAAELVGYTPQTLIKYIKAGKLIATGRGRHYFILGKDLLKWCGAGD